jgi:hypothetical protein
MKYDFFFFFQSESSRYSEKYHLTIILLLDWGVPGFHKQ